jgi:diguanylate cyclase (GGDEF)-like protein/PAS domain S-box-containing protein
MSGGGVKEYRPHLFALCALVAVLLTGLPDGMQNALVDLRFHWFPRVASGHIVVVAIDSPSIEQIGVWPWPRRLHAELIEKLESAGANDIAFDVDFSTPSDPAFDQALVDALQRAGGSVVLPTFKQLVDTENGKTIHVNRPLPQFGKHAWPAIVNVAVETDGLVRRYPFGETFDGTFLPSMGVALAGGHQAKEGTFWIDYSIRSESVPSVSYVDVLRGDPAVAKRLANKKVIVGGTALELGDRFSIPNGRAISGVLLQALAAESILQGRMLRPSSPLVRLGGAALVALLMVVLWCRSSAFVRVAVLVGLAIVAELGAALLQAKFPVILDASYFHLAIAAYLVAIVLDEIDFRDLIGRIAEKRFQRIAMSLGDGLVCADRNGLITVWNPGAVAIFGYEPEEMTGQPLERICAVDDGPVKRVPFSLPRLPHGALRLPGGKVMELDGRRKSGEVFPLEACFSGWQATDGFHYGAILRDISVRKREAERIRYLAEYDTLTGLANRNALHAQLCAKLSQAWAKRCEVALLVIGLDKFQQINDMLGHAYGDQVLCAVAERLRALIEGTELVARLSGDEFAIVIGSVEAAERATTLAERTAMAFSEVPLSVGLRRQALRVSVGVAILQDCVTADELLGNAHLALSRAKAGRRGGYVLFERRIREELEARLTLEAELGWAVERNEFELFYQPQVSLIDGGLVGAEALIRWRHPDRGLVLPADFMPVVNASPISDGIAVWVMETACGQGRRWQQKGHNVRLGVNLSPSQLQSGDLAATVGRVLRDTGFAPSLLELEVTEDILLVDDEKALEIFGRIQNLGVRIVLDDFGTGYASLSYLKKFPIDGLKIDKSFVRELQAGSDDAAIVGSTIGLSRQLGLTVIAEGIEERATAQLLASIGCKEGQGYYFGHPMPVAEFEQRFLSNDACMTSPVPVTKLASTAA